MMKKTIAGMCSLIMLFTMLLAPVNTIAAEVQEKSTSVSELDITSSTPESEEAVSPATPDEPSVPAAPSSSQPDLPVSQPDASTETEAPVSTPQKSEPKATIVPQEETVTVAAADVVTTLPAEFPALGALTNVALGKPVTSNLECFKASANDARAYRLVDGLTSGEANTFVQLAGGSNGDWTLTVDLEEVKTISVVALYRSVLNGLESFTVQVSTDGTSWTQLGELAAAESTDATTRYIVPQQAAQARYVRLFAPDAAAWKMIPEMEVYEQVSPSLTEVEATISRSWPATVPAKEDLENVALKKSVTSNLVCYNVAGGNRLPVWLTDGTTDELVQLPAGDGGDWELTVDLGKSHEVVLAAYLKATVGANNNIKKYTVQLSEDGVSWRQLGSVVEDTIEPPADHDPDDRYFVPTTKQTARYVRLFAPGALAWQSAGELELYVKKETATGPNLSLFPNLALLHSKASLSEPEYPNHPAKHAVDGLPDTYAQADKGQNFDIILEWEKPQTFNTLQMLGWYNSSAEDDQRIEVFALHVSEDGTNWTKVAEHTLTEEELKKEFEKDCVFTFEEQTTRFFKFETVKVSDVSWSAMRELELYDTAKTPPVNASMQSGSTVTKGSVVELSCGMDAKIYYTLDGSDPTLPASRKLYTAPLVVDGDMNLAVCAIGTDMKSSNISTFQYFMQWLDTTPSAGIVPSATLVEIVNHMSDTDVFYTLDGSDPRLSDTATKYASPLTIDDYTVITAYSKAASGTKTSPVYEFVFATGNAATGKTITASTETADHLAADAIDDSNSTYWQPTKNQKGEWVMVDFGTSYDFSGLSIEWLEENAGYQYIVETSNDGYSWFPYYDCSLGGNSSTLHQTRNVEVHRRYMRIKILGAKADKNYGIKNIEVVGKPSAAVPEIPMVDEPDTEHYDRVVVNPIPVTTAGVAEPTILLNGIWQFKMMPENGFWRNTTDLSGWDDVKLPGDLDARGQMVYKPYDDPDWRGGYGDMSFHPRKNMEMPFVREVFVPEDYAGKKVFLRVDKAFSFARVWVNGVYVREHRGAYNAWDADITEYVVPGENNRITIAITAEDNDGFTLIELPNTRGILDDITMYATDKTYFNRLHTITDLDENFENATLSVLSNIVLESGKTAKIELALTDMDGKKVALETSSIDITQSFTDANIDIPINKPAKWDDEHPNLYTLTANLVVDGATVETVVRKVGFRKITIDGRVFKINGNATKLRGVNYLTVYGVDGMAYDFEVEKMMLESLKQNNINYIRAAHYPLSTNTLELCDELGIFIEQENSICFADGNTAAAGVKDHPKYLNYMLHCISEMVEKDRSHPSIIMWSIANESQWGPNYKKAAEYIKAADPTIPTNFSWGNHVPANEPSIDVKSNHYLMDGDHVSKPSVWDEYAHGFTNEAQVLLDPSTRIHYYNVIKDLWDAAYADEGIMGGAIWCVNDNTYEGLNRVMGNTNWGQFDSWFREKPEIWETRSVYSPVQYKDGDAVNYPGKTKALELMYENRYETVNFADKDFEVLYSVNGATAKDLDATLAAKTTGNLAIQAPTEGWKIGDTVKVEFYKTTGGIRRSVMTNIVTIGKPEYSFAPMSGVAPSVTETDSDITIAGENFTLGFSKTTGKITSGSYGNTEVLVGGPHLNLGLNTLGKWALSAISAKATKSAAIVTIKGTYGIIGITFTLNIDSLGQIETAYAMDNNSAIRTYEVGVGYDLAPDANQISWARSGYQSWYPDSQLARNQGSAVKEIEGWKREYGVKPTYEWKDDDKEFYLFGVKDTGGRGTNDFRSSKQNFYYAEMAFADSSSLVQVQGDGTGSVRASINSEGSVRLNVNNLWGYTYHGLNRSNHGKVVTATAGYSATMKMSLGNTANNYALNYETSDEKITVSESGGFKNISEHRGTLQLAASETNVSWSLEQMDGSTSDRATISASGLLTATKNGVVVAVATAKSGSGARGAYLVSITGQKGAHSVTVVNGSGSGSFFPKDVVAIKAETLAGKEFTSWTGTAGVTFADASASSTTLVMPDADVTVTAQYIDTVEVTGVTLDAGSKSLVVGEKFSLTTTVTPDNATNKAVTWKSSNDAIAAVDANGMVTAKSEGAATITATTQNGSKTASCTVTVNKATDPPPTVVAVTGVTLNKKTLTLVRGTSKTLAATVNPAGATDKAVSWASGDDATASVDANGVVTAKKVGKTTITVTTKDGSQTASCAVEVTPIRVAKVTLNILSKDLKVGKTVQLKATVSPTDAADKKITWKSSNSKIATVNSSGKVTAKKNGNARITATVDGKSAKAAIRVSSKYIAVTSVKISSSKIALNAKGSAALKATISPTKASNKKVVWASSNPAVASVSASGKITAKTVGKATITVTSQEGGKVARCTVTVKAAVTSVKISKTAVSLKPGKTTTLKLTVAPKAASGTVVTWKTSNAKVATVGSSGKVKAVGKGTASITAVVGGKTIKCRVTVK